MVSILYVGARLRALGSARLETIPALRGVVALLARLGINLARQSSPARPSVGFRRLGPYRWGPDTHTSASRSWTNHLPTVRRLAEVRLDVDG